MSDNTETDALLTLADRIDEADERPIVIHKGAATELRRIRALNAELVEALRQIEPILARMYGAQAADLPPMQIVRAALAKVEGGK